MTKGAGILKDRVFLPADILIPRAADMERWSVIACDQFSSDRAYWERVDQFVGDAPSTLRMILPEAFIGERPEAEFAAGISAAMKKYIDDGVFAEYPSSFVYAERNLPDGKTRRGLIGAIDLDAYDYSPGSRAPIRASERTAADRLPPRVAARKSAPLDLPHVLALIDDAANSVIEPIAETSGSLEKLYDFKLMEGGGFVRGWRVAGADAERASAALAALPGEAKIIIGDGNHSLAAAKTHWESLKKSGSENKRARYALVELNNVYDPAVEFLPIHRVVFGADAAFVRRLRDRVGGEGGYEAGWRSGGASGKFSVRAECVGDVIEAVQSFIDEEAEKTNFRVDYIHGDEALETLSSAPDRVGLSLPAMDKSDFFKTVLSRGVFPRKSFSIGEARDKRYYLECAKII
jgi:uncharacterized protein (DUF1015 family)